MNNFFGLLKYNPWCVVVPTPLEALNNSITVHSAAKAAVVENVKKYMEHLQKTLFKLYPIEAIIIRGYTPSFNDGDPCTFSSNLETPGIKFKDMDLMVDHEEWTTEEGEYVETPLDNEEEIYEKVCEAYRVIPDWALEQIYESYGFQLTITEDSVEKDWYDCGY